MSQHDDRLRQGLCVVDGTGGYELECCEILAGSGFVVHCANSYRVKSYIRSLGEKAKTDSIDARHLAAYGDERGKDFRKFAVQDGSLTTILLKKGKKRTPFRAPAS